MPHWPLPGWPERALHSYTLTELQLALIYAPEMVKPDIRRAIEDKREENARVDLPGDRTVHRAREKAIRRGAKPEAETSGTRKAVNRALPVLSLAGAVAGYQQLASIGLVAERIPDNPFWLNVALMMAGAFWLIWFALSTLLGRE